MHPALFGVVYFLVVFLAGFVLGTIRVTLLAPTVGALPAVMIELPFILAIAWFVAGYLLRRLPLDAARNEDIGAGVLAFLLLIVAEALLALQLSGRMPAEFLARMITPEGLVGLGGQIVFAALPTLRNRSA